MATKTIGTGGDYTSYALYLAYLQTLGTLSAPEIGRQKNQELVVAGGIDFTGFTPTSSNPWTLEAEPGASFRDHANKASNALRYNASNGAGIKSTDNYNTTLTISVPSATIRNLQILNDGLNASAVVFTGSFGSSGDVTLDNLIVQANDFDSHAIRFQGSADKIRNSIIICNEDATVNSNAPIQFRNGGGAYFCTFVRPTNRTSGGDIYYANYAPGVANNCVWVGFSNTAGGGGGISGANNAIDQASFPAGLSGQINLSATTEFEQPSNSGGALDFRLKSTSVKCKDNGSTDGTNGANDIIGTARPSGAAYDIGCWEFAGGGGPAVFANPFALLGVGRAS